MPFTEKYNPKNLKELVDQTEALEQFLKWIKKWKPGNKALLFHGMPGVGKTALIHAYANEKNLDFVEMNASDWRSANQIEGVIGQSMKQIPLFKKGKIFLIDECDGLAGRADIGGVGAIIKIIKETRFPVVLIANNPYDSRLRILRQYCELIPFKKIPVCDIEKRLKQICSEEKIKYDEEILRQIAKRSGGDLRSAINDLELISQGKDKIFVDDIDVLGYREREKSIFDALMMIFKTKTALAAKLAIDDVDKDPEEIFWWIENNIASEYEDPREIAKAFDIMSKADLFRQRISSRQNWRFKAYMIDLMTAGVATAKKEMYHKFTRYQYPRNIMILGSTKMERKETREILDKISRSLHASKKKLKSEYLPFLKIILKNRKNMNEISSSLGVEKEELRSLFK
jgi:replication factor C large subunit